MSYKKNSKFTAAWVVLVMAACIISCTGNKKEQDANIVTTGDTLVDELSAKIAADSSNAINYFNRSRAYAAKEFFDLAFADIEKAISLDSGKAEYYMHYSDMSFRLNKTRATRDALMRVRILDPQNYDAALRLAELFLFVQKTDVSMKYLDTVLTKDPLNGKALLMLGFNQKEKGDTLGAIKTFRTAVDNNPKFYDAQMQLGVLMQAQDNKLAVDYFTNCISINPNSEEALYGRGLWYQDHNELNKSIQDYTTIIQINKNNAQAHFNLGYIHQIYLKVYREAIKHYGNAISAAPHYREAYYNRALCLETLGDIGNAKIDYQKALEIKPDYQLAKEGLERVSK